VDIKHTKVTPILCSAPRCSSLANILPCLDISHIAPLHVARPHQSIT
jgi:hypothetical protein